MHLFEIYPRDIAEDIGDYAASQAGGEPKTPFNIPLKAHGAYFVQMILFPRSRIR